MRFFALSFTFSLHGPSQMRSQMHMPNKGNMETDPSNNRHRTIARSFSQELGDIFRIDNSVADLDEQIDKRSASPHPREAAYRTRPSG